MDEEMGFVEKFVADDASSFSDDIDSEYEFDVFQVFDFTREETESEAEEAESWFRFAREYPPSPFIVKLKQMKAAKATPKKVHKTSSRKMESDEKTNSSSISDGETNHKAASREVKIKGMKHHNLVPQDILKAKTKSTVNLSKPNGSAFMKPTASQLAKQNKECDIHLGGCGRLQKPLVSPGEKLRSPIRCQNQATKRQKLEIGYMRKVAQLKHRVSFLHKITIKAAHLEGSLNSRIKTTIPKKPALVTEERAQRRRSQNRSESNQQPKANAQAFRARPLNRKILDPPKLPVRKKSMTTSTEFQVLSKQNSAPAISEDILIKRRNSGNAGKDKCRSPNNLKPCTSAKVHPIKDGGAILNSKRNSQLPPIELFKKLSLKPESETKPPRVTKAQKENVPGSFQKFRKCVGKPNHCGSDSRITEVKT